MMIVFLFFFVGYTEIRVNIEAAVHAPRYFRSFDQKKDKKETKRSETSKQHAMCTFQFSVSTRYIFFLLFEKLVGRRI